MGQLALPDRSILIVDDEPLALSTLSRVFRGWRASLVGDPMMALGLFAAHDFDALIADLVMQPIDGIELCRRARAMSFAGAAVVYSGYVTREVRARALRAGAHAVLAKDVSADLLRDQLTSLLELRDSQPPHSARRAALEPVRRLACALDLSRIEERVLVEIAREGSGDGIAQRVWGRSGTRHQFDVVLGRLRRKLEASGWAILSPESGRGYRLAGPGDQAARAS
jgi:DNA-binding response OmpR family regulator